MDSVSTKEKLKKHYRHVRQWVTEFGLPTMGNPRKLWRGIKWEFFPHYRQYPPFVILDPIVNCNLKCPLCSIPPKVLPHFGSKLTMETFETILSNIKGVTNKVFFCHAGEPFLNRSLFDMVARVNQENLYSLVGTNGTLLTEKNIARIFSSGLDYLQISFDGFSKDTYEKYRVGANFDRALQSIINLQKTKIRGNHKKPFISITFLVNAYNCQEVDAAVSFFSKLKLQFIPKGINLNLHRRKDDKVNDDLGHWIETQSKYSIYRRDDSGNLSYKSPFKPVCDTCEKPVINCKGDILLCCHDIFNSVKLGNIEDGDFKSLWLSREYRSFRALAAQRKLPLCKVCGK